MKYEAARKEIKNGHIVGVCGRGLFGLLIRTAQRIGGLGYHSVVTHVGVAWWVEGRLFIVEMDGLHNVLRPMSHYINSGCVVDVYDHAFLKDMQMLFDSATLNHIRYSYLDLLKIGLRLVLKIKTGSDDSDLVCSTFASRWLQWAGWTPPSDFPVMPSPGELCRALGAPSFSIKDDEDFFNK